MTVPAKDGSAYLGDLPLTIGADDSLTFPSDRAVQLLSQVLAPDILDSLQASVADKLLVGPADLNAGGIHVVYDPRTLELRFVIAPQLRAARSLSVTPLDRQQLGTYVKPQDFSAYLNVRGSVDLVEDGFDTGFSARKRVLETVGYWCLTDLACAWAALPNARRLASMAMRALISSVLMSSGSNGRPYHSSMDLRFG